MAFFNRIETEDSALERVGAQTVSVTLDIGRLLATTILGVVLVVGAIVLWMNGQQTPAAAVFALGEAVITGGLGLAVGERSGAADMANKKH
jgi:hypothetical protein